VSESKACTKCKQVIELTLFKKDKRSNTGYASICLACHSHQSNAYRLSNPLAVQESWKKTYTKHRAKRIANSKNWSANNPNKRKQIEAKYRANNRLETQARSEAWGLANPNKRREYKLRRRARLESNGQHLILAKEIARIYSSPCFYCGGHDRIEADHIIPVSKGGRHSVGNLIPACRWCNASKGNRFISEWKREKHASV